MLLLEPLLRIFQMPVESFQLSKDYLMIVLGGLFFLTPISRIPLPLQVAG